MNTQYYAELKRKIQAKENKNVQRHISEAFEFVERQQELREQFQEVLKQEQEAKEVDKKGKK